MTSQTRFHLIIDVIAEGTLDPVEVSDDLTSRITKLIMETPGLSSPALQIKRGSTEFLGSSDGL